LETDFHGSDIPNTFAGCLTLETDFRGSDIPNTFSGCLILETDFYGTDIPNTMRITANIEECILLCTEMKHCKSFTFITSNRVCHFKNIIFYDPDMVFRVDAVSGIIEHCSKNEQCSAGIFGDSDSPFTFYDFK
jgi:hypothetical protein